MNKVIIGMLGSRLDHGGLGRGRANRWRPSVSLLMQAELPVHEFVLIHHPDEAELAEITTRDMRELSPQTRVTPYLVTYRDPWDFEEVYGQLLDFTRKRVLKDTVTATGWVYEVIKKIC